MSGRTDRFVAEMYRSVDIRNRAIVVFVVMAGAGLLLMTPAWMLGIVVVVALLGTAVGLLIWAERVERAARASIVKPNFEAMTDDQLRAWLEGNGFTVPIDGRATRNRMLDRADYVWAGL